MRDGSKPSERLCRYLTTGKPGFVLSWGVARLGLSVFRLGFSAFNDKKCSHGSGRVHPDRTDRRPIHHRGAHCIGHSPLHRSRRLGQPTGAAVIGGRIESTREPGLVAHQAFNHRMDRRCRGVLAGGYRHGPELQMGPFGHHRRRRHPLQGASAETGAPAFAAGERRQVEPEIAAILLLHSVAPSSQAPSEPTQLS